MTDTGLETAKELDLSRFCQRGFRFPRIGWREPWCYDGWRYATNGAIIVRTPTGQPDTPDAPTHPAEVFGPVGNVTWQPWPEPRYELEYSACWMCVNNVCGKPLDLDVCPMCGGKGWELFPAAWHIAGRRFGGELCWLISTLPKPVTYAGTEDEEAPLLFRFAGGEGRVMPLASTHRCYICGEECPGKDTMCADGRYGRQICKECAVKHGLVVQDEAGESEQESSDDV